MAYQITKSDGTILVELAQGFTDSVSSSLTFVGKNVSGFGEIQNNNFLHLLENFSSATSPTSPLTGQLWFDKGNDSLKIFSNTGWKDVGVVSYSSTSTYANTEGNLWFDSANRQLYINNGSGFSLIGPDGAPDLGPSRMITTLIRDTSNVKHPVITATLNSSTMAIFSLNTFDVNSLDAIDGFPTIYSGITLKNGDTTSVQLYGSSKYSENATYLKIEGVSSYTSASTGTLANTIVQRDGVGGTSLNKLTVSNISTSTSGSISGTWAIAGNFNPDVTDTRTLGTTSLKWNNIYATRATATTVDANTVNFTNLTDSYAYSVSKFDTDTTLAANSDTRLATQRAIKKYIDDAVAAEVALRLSGDNNLQNQINNLQTIPAGTILFIAGSTIPAGFLAANGQTVAKATYPALYAALGAIGSPYGQSSTTFNLPDLRGEFIRAWDNSRGLDAGRILGTIQYQQTARHKHIAPYSEAFTGPFGQTVTAGKQGSAKTDYDNYYYFTNDGTDLDSGAVNPPNAIGDETRPRNIALQAIIKY